MNWIERIHSTIANASKFIIQGYEKPREFILLLFHLEEEMMTVFGH